MSENMTIAKGEYLRAHEVARMLGISHDMVLRLLRKKRLPGVKLGKVWLVRGPELRRLLELKTKFEEVDE